MQTMPVDREADARRRKRKKIKFKARVHSKRRYAERFEDTITPAQRRDALKQVREGKALGIKDANSDTRKIYLVQIGNKWRKCVYDSEISDIVTFLPGGR